MAAVVAALEADLRALAHEAGRSLPAVKDAASIATAGLSSDRERFVGLAQAASEGRSLEGAGKLEDVFRPFLLACNHKNASSRLVVVALSSIQRLLHADVLDTDERMHVMQVLVIQAQRAKASKEIEVKTLQTLPLLLVPRLHPVTEEILFAAVGLCCHLFEQDAGLASAALTQIVTSLFERVEFELQAGEAGLSEPERANARINSASALKLLEELTVAIAAPISTAGAGGVALQHQDAQQQHHSQPHAQHHSSHDHPAQSAGRLSPFFRSSSSSPGPSQPAASGGAASHGLGLGLGRGTPPAGVLSSAASAQKAVRQMRKSLALELLETILSGHAALFVAQGGQTPFGDFVRSRACPVISKAFGGRCDWRLMVRLLRTVVVLLCGLRPALRPEDVHTLLGLLLEMLDDGEEEGTCAAGASGGNVRFVTPLWHRVLTLETLNILCSHQDLLGEFQTRFARATDRRGPPPPDAPRVSAFVHIVQALCHLVGRVLRQPKVAAGIDAIAARPTKGLDLLSEEEPPQNLSDSLVTLLAAECLASIADGMALSQGLAGSDTRLSPIVQIGRVHSRGDLSPPPLLKRQSTGAAAAAAQERQQRAAAEAAGDEESASSRPPAGKEAIVRREVVSEMMRNCWKPMLEALALLLQSCNNENIVQFILKAYMSMTNTCGILGLVEARNAFIMSLCTFSLPNWHSSAAILPAHVPRSGQGSNDLQAKHLQALKALFNIAHGLGAILEDAWPIVLETFEQLDHIMFRVAVEKKLTTSGTVHVTGMGPSRGNGAGPGAGAHGDKNGSDWHLVDDEMAIVESMLRFLFNSTKYLDEDALRYMQTALTQLSFTVLAHTETMRTLSRQESAAAEKFRLERESYAPARSEGWISSTVQNITNSIADLTSAAYDSDQERDVDSSKYDLDIDLSARRRALAERQQSDAAGQQDAPSPSSSPQPPQPKGPPTPPSAGRLSFSGDSGMTQRRASDQQAAPQSPGTPIVDGVLARATYRNPPFAIEKLVETTRLNTFRIGLLWEMTQNVLSTVASKSDPKLRLYGVQAMEELITTALLFEPSETRSGTNSPAPAERAEKDDDSLLKPISPAPLSDPKVASPVPDAHNGGHGVKAEYPLPRTMQVHLLEGFSHLFKSHHFDAREAAVQSLHRIIGTCGHVLDEGWGIVIAELRNCTGTTSSSPGGSLERRESGASGELPSSPTTGATPPMSPPEYSPKEVAKLVPLAFKAVQLIVDDFLHGLTLECRMDLARCIRAFGDQDPHVNISLTSITMLWTMCDHVQKECPEPLKSGAHSTAEAARAVDECNALLLYVFEQLNHLSLDRRPEVRNCAVRTLCSIIVACAPKLKMDSWRICNMGILFPLLDKIITLGFEAPTEQVHGEVLGRLSGERARVHHSLDTLEKQWRETIVTTIQGSTRVVRATIQCAGHMEWSLKTWEIMLSTIRSTLRRKPQNNVSLAATRSMQELAALVTGSSKARFAAVGMQVVNGALVRVDSEGNAESPSRSLAALDDGAPLPEGTPVDELWGIVWRSYESVTEAGEPEEKGGAPPLSGIGAIAVATDLATGLGDLYSSNNGNHYLRTADLLERCMRLLTRLLRAFPARSKHITGLERAVLATVENLPPVPDGLWPVVFDELRTYVSGAELEGFSAGFSTKAQALFVALYEKKAPAIARALVFEHTIEAFPAAARDGDAVAGAAAPMRVVWGIEGLGPIFKFGLRALSTCEWPAARIEGLWMRLLLMLQTLLQPATLDDEPARWGLSVKDGLQLLNVVMEEARPLILASRVPADVQDRLFELLHSGCAVRPGDASEAGSPDASPTDAGATAPASSSAPASEASSTDDSSFDLARACLEHLVTLSSVSSNESEKLSERVLPALVSGVEQVASAYLEKGDASGVRESDVVALLQKLRQLELSTLPQRYLSLYDEASVRAADRKAHLLILFPSLNRLTIVESVQIRAELQQLFAALATALLRPP